MTGGSAGLGAAICADLAARGYDIVNVDIARPADKDHFDRLKFDQVVRFPPSLDLFPDRIGNYVLFEVLSFGASGDGTSHPPRTGDR